MNRDIGDIIIVLVSIGMHPIAIIFYHGDILDNERDCKMESSGHSLNSWMI